MSTPGLPGAGAATSAPARRPGRGLLGLLLAQAAG
jgi:hypothetical protein